MGFKESKYIRKNTQWDFNRSKGNWGNTQWDIEGSSVLVKNAQ